MACPGLHCAACGGGAAVPVVPLAAVFGLAWVAEHLIAVALISAGSGVLSVAAVVVLGRWQDRHAAMVWAARGPARAVVPPVVRAPVAARLERPAIAPPPQLVVNIFGTASPEQAAAVRSLLSGQAGDAITEEGKQWKS